MIGKRRTRTTVITDHDYSAGFEMLDDNVEVGDEQSRLRVDWTGHVAAEQDDA